MSSVKNIFDWVNHINQYKTPLELFTDEDWDKFNSYLIHRLISMNPDYIEIVNEVQSMNPQDKKQIYSIYKELIPVNKKWNKYVKSTIKERSKDLIEFFKGYFELSTREVKEYIKMLGDEEIIRILTQHGIEQKEIKKLLK